VYRLLMDHNFVSMNIYEKKALLVLPFLKLDSCTHLLSVNSEQAVQMLHLASEYCGYSLWFINKEPTNFFLSLCQRSMDFNAIFLFDLEMNLYHLMGHMQWYKFVKLALVYSDF